MLQGGGSGRGASDAVPASSAKEEYYSYIYQLVAKCTTSQNNYTKAWVMSKWAWVLVFPAFYPIPLDCDELEFMEPADSSHYPLWEPASSQ
jgi:hypothetical protein